jgi:type IV pilus assembly protein PilM
VNILTKLFPTPSFVTIPTVGLDFSDATMRFIDLQVTTDGLIPKRFAQEAIPEGCMKGGRIIDNEKFIKFLKEVQKEHKLKYVRVSIPESQVYSFTLSLDVSAASDIRGAIDFLIEDNIPLKAIETVFDYHILSVTDKNIIVQVVALPEMVATNYFNAFFSAGIIPVSFELEGQAISRAVLKPEDKGSCMIVDFGANRTGITIITNRTAIVTATLDFGGKVLTQSLAKELNIALEEAESLKREFGLTAVGEHSNIFSILANGISVLKDEINRRYVYWHEKKNQLGSFPQIDTVYLCGGHSNLRGLGDYLSANLKLKVVQVNPWANCFSLEDVIPEMHYDISMSYTTAIGLALADYIYD